MKLSPHKTGLIMGLFMALLHTVWSILVYTGVAWVVLSFVYGLHFLNNPFKMLVFDWGRALGLIAFTFAAGYMMGFVFAFIWNKIRK